MRAHGAPSLSPQVPRRLAAPGATTVGHSHNKHGAAHRGIQTHEPPALSLYGSIDAVIEHVREESAQINIVNGQPGRYVGMHLKGYPFLACATRL